VAFALCTGEGALDSWEPGRCDVARWTQAAGTERLLADAQPQGISADGQVVLIQGQAASLWSAVSGLTALPLQAVVALSDDGRVVLGESADPQNALVSLPARWTASEGVQTIDLGPLPEGVRGAHALTLSGDASTVVGFLYDDVFFDPIAPQPLDIFRWTAAGGIERTSARYQTQPDWRTAVFSSTDGARISSVLDSSANPRSSDAVAFRWTAMQGVMELKTPDGVPLFSYVSGSRADGQRLLTTLDSVPVLWEPERGFWRLDESLQSAGVSLDGWLFQDPLALSGDGRVVVGQGFCDGLPALFRAALPD
jgi:hypothetical protein